jgi:hypothetical protein
MAFKTDLYHSSFWMHELLVALLSLLFLLWGLSISSEERGEDVQSYNKLRSGESFTPHCRRFSSRILNIAMELVGSQILAKVVQYHQSFAYYVQVGLELSNSALCFHWNPGPESSTEAAYENAQRHRQLSCHTEPLKSMPLWRYVARRRNAYCEKSAIYKERRNVMHNSNITCLPSLSKCFTALQRTYTSPSRTAVISVHVVTRISIRCYVIYIIRVSVCHAYTALL